MRVWLIALTVFVLTACAVQPAAQNQPQTTRIVERSLANVGPVF